MIKKSNTTLGFHSIAAFIDTSGSRYSRGFGFIGLATGVLLLLCSIQLFVDINKLLRENSPRTSGYDFISVTKTITNDNMGKDNRFVPAEIAGMKSQPFIEDATPLISNQFRAKASAGTIIPFSTDLFLEAIDTAFIDTVPPNFTWQTGQQTIPIIFSADFLEMYNVFAPAQDLPQLSQSTVSSVNIILECYGPAGVYNFRANIVGVSDRINSVLVPRPFLEWANLMFGNSKDAPASRVYIKTVDANNPDLLNFLQEKGYHVNKDKTKFGRAKQVLQSIVSGLGIFALLVIVLAMMLFSFYLQLIISRSKDNLKLLMLLGYSPQWLTKNLSAKWIPLYAVIIFTALALTAILQYLFYLNLVTVHQPLSPMLHYSVFIVALLLFIIAGFVNYRMIKKLLVNL